MSIFCIQVDDCVKRITTQRELNGNHSEDENAIMILEQHPNDLQEAESQSSEDFMVKITHSFRITDSRKFDLDDLS